MNEWASRILHKVGNAANSVMAADSASPNSVNHLDDFMKEIEQDQVAKMDYQQEFDKEVECKPSFEQLSYERIINEANKNVQVLKALEIILTERLAGFAANHNMWNKMRSNFESFEHSEGTLKLALDSFFVLVDHETSQSNHDPVLVDARKMVKDISAETQKKIVEYQKDRANAENDVVAMEKKLNKLKLLLEKAAEKRAIIEASELESNILSRSTTKSNHSSSSARELKLKENEDNILRIEQELRDDVRSLLNSIENRDTVLSASRRAFQKLDLECKEAASEVLRKISALESEHAHLNLQVTEKFHMAVSAISTEADARHFVSNYTVTPDRGALTLSSQALSLLHDLTPQPSVLEKFQSSSERSLSDRSEGPSGTTSACTTPRGSFSSVRSARNSLSSGIAGEGTVDSSMYIDPATGIAAADSHTIRYPQVLPVLSSPSPVFENDWARRAKKDNVEFTEHLSAIFYSEEKSQQELDQNSSQKDGPSCNNGDDTGIWNIGFSKPSGGVGGNRNDSSSSSSSSIRNSSNSSGASSTNSSGNDSSSSSSSKRGSGSEATDSSTTTADVSSVAPVHLPSVQWLIEQMKHKEGRDSFTLTLNQFRSRQVELQDGAFSALGAVLWEALTHCQQANDVHNAKVIMMLSQTFYRRLLPKARRKGDDDNDKDYSTFKSIGGRGHARDKNWKAKGNEEGNGNGDGRTKERGEGDTEMRTSFSSRSDSDDLEFQDATDVSFTAPTASPEPSPRVGMSLTNSASKLDSKHDDNDRDNHSKNTILAINKANANGTNDFERVSHSSCDSSNNSDVNDSEDEDGGDAGKRGVQYREYIKVLLTAHLYWRDGNYWEQALCQCAFEQLQTMPCDKVWHDMDKETRHSAVIRVHDVIFSQVMALIHSMVELNCSLLQAREFLYRMCVVHQLSEGQRQQLLLHIIDRGGN